MKTVIDWSKSPESAEYSYQGNWWKVVNDILFRFEPKSLHSSLFCGYHWARSGYTTQLTEKMTRRAEPKPVFTQAMADKGELPPVGSECMVLGDPAFDYDYHKCLIVAHTEPVKDLYVIVGGRPYYYSHSSRNNFKPIDTRTDKEKSIDKLMNDEYILNDLRGRDLVTAAYDKWVGK